MSTVGQISLPGSIYLHYTEDFIFEIMMFACIFAINVLESKMIKPIWEWGNISLFCMEKDLKLAELILT